MKHSPVLGAERSVRMGPGSTVATRVLICLLTRQRCVWPCLQIARSYTGRQNIITFEVRVWAGGKLLTCT